jgi:hypothetical protein
MLMTVCLLALLGCTAIGGDLPRPGTPQEAEAIATAWLAAVESGAPDRGWSLLHPLSRQRLYENDSARYVAEVEAIKWDEFHWRLEPPAVLDGNYQVRVAIEGNDAPTELLAKGHLIQSFPSEDGTRRAQVTVLIEWDGTRGVLGP